MQTVADKYLIYRSRSLETFTILLKQKSKQFNFEPLIGFPWRTLMCFSKILQGLAFNPVIYVSSLIFEIGWVNVQYSAKN